MNRAKLGDRVRVRYLRPLKDGTVTKKNGRRQVLEFTVGGDQVIPGISLGVVGMAQRRA